MKSAQKENFEIKIKPLIENLKNELYQLENKQAKSANVRANITQELEGKKGRKLSSEYLKDRICKLKQYFNYILMIINQNIRETFLYLQKNHEKLYTKKTSAAEFLTFLAKS